MTYLIVISLWVFGVIETLAIRNTNRKVVLIQAGIAIWILYVAFWCSMNLWGASE